MGSVLYFRPIQNPSAQFWFENPKKHHCELTFPIAFIFPVWAASSASFAAASAFAASSALAASSDACFLQGCFLVRRLPQLPSPRGGRPRPRAGSRPTAGPSWPGLQRLIHFYSRFQCFSTGLAWLSPPACAACPVLTLRHHAS